MEGSYDADYHLTPAGWVRGTVYFFAKQFGQKVPRPPDSVLTIKLSVRQESPSSPPQRSWYEAWRSSNAPPVYISNLRRLYPLHTMGL